MAEMIRLRPAKHRQIVQQNIQWKLALPGSVHRCAAQTGVPKQQPTLCAYSRSLQPAVPYRHAFCCLSGCKTSSSQARCCKMVRALLRDLWDL